MQDLPAGQARTPGGVRAFCLLLAGLGLVLAPAGADTFLPLPQEGTGEIPFVLDAAAFLSAAGQPEVYFCLAVPEERVVCAEPEAGATAPRIEVELELDNLNAAGDVLFARTQRLDVPCELGATNEGRAAPPAQRLLFLTAPWLGAEHRFELRLKDLNATRRGLIYQLTGAKRRGIVRASVSPADLDGARGLSGGLFLWGFGEEAFEAEGAGWWRAPAAGARDQIQPHPARIYGLRREQLSYYCEAYRLAGWVVVSAELRRLPGGEAVVRREARLQLVDERAALVCRLPVGELAAGSYDLRIRLAAEDGGGALFTAGGHAQVIWRPESWNRTQAALLDEASLLLSERQLQRYRRLEPGRREALVESVWTALDGRPAAGSIIGPKRALYRERVEIADARFSGREPGRLTDRGRVYIHFGEPDEVHKELLPREQDQIAYFLEEEIGDAEEGQTGGTLKRNLHDDSAYQVWYYMHSGEPLLPDRYRAAHGQELKFIFVDRLGTGEYRLIYSTVYGGFR